MHHVTTTENKPSRRILLVSYWYPPALGAAAERIGAFAKYLPDYGWQTHVLTAERPDTPAAADDEPITVHAVRDPHAAKSPAFADYDPTALLRPPMVKSFLRDLVFPDRFVRWQRAAVNVGIDRINQHKPDLILASFPPASAVLLALRLHEATKVPLVLDFRDRWFGPGGYEPQRPAARNKHEQLQRNAITAATALIAVSDNMADALADEHRYHRDRIFVIPNGYEPATIAVSQSGPPAADIDHQPPNVNPESPGPLTIAHVGTVIPRNRPDLFFESIAKLKNDDRLQDTTFRFVGNLSRDYLREAGLSGLITTTGMLPRDQAHNEMRIADALLLLTGAYVARWGHNAKLFEYIQTGRPILCLEEQPDSNDRKLLDRFARDRVFAAPVNDPEEIAEQVTRLRQHVRRNPTPALELDDAFREYSRPSLAARLAEYLDAIVLPPQT